MNKLKIHRASSGQWAGIILRDGQEIGAIAGCANPKEVEQTAMDTGYSFDEVELDSESATQNAN